MLILMPLAHLPTQARVVTNQQLGFVTEAEGFVFLSAFLTGRIFARVVNEFGFPTVINRLWTPTRRHKSGWISNSSLGLLGSRLR
jgi:hypothetical protein